MLSLVLTTSVIICALPTALVPGVRGADTRIPTRRISTTRKSLQADTIKKTTVSSLTDVLEYATVLNISDDVKLYSQTIMLPIVRPTQTHTPFSTEQWLTVYQTSENRRTQWWDDNTFDAATRELSDVSTAGKSTESPDRTTMPAKQTSYEPPYQPSSSLSGRAQADERQTEPLIQSVSSLYLDEMSTNKLQHSPTSVPDNEVSFLDSKESAFTSTVTEPSSPFDVTFSLVESIAVDISINSIATPSGFGSTAVSLENDWTKLPSETNEQQTLDVRPRTYLKTANFSTDITIAQYERSSKTEVKTESLSATQSNKQNSRQDEVSSAVDHTSLPLEHQVSEAHYAQFESSESLKVTAHSLESHLYTEKYDSITNVLRTASKYASQITNLQPELRSLALDLDGVRSSQETQTVNFLAGLYQQSSGESTTELTFETRQDDLSTNFEEKKSLTSLPMTLLLEASGVITELTSARCPLLHDVGTTAASQLSTFTSDKQHEQSSIVGTSTPLHELQQYHPSKGVSVMTLLLKTLSKKPSTVQYFPPSNISETSSISATKSTDQSSEQSFKLNPTVFVLETHPTELPSAQEESSSSAISMIHTDRFSFAPTKELSESTTGSIIAIEKPASKKIITVTALAAGSVVLLLIIFGSALAFVAYKAGKTGSFLLPQMDPTDAEMGIFSTLTIIDPNHKSAPAKNGCENEAFV